MYDTQKEITLNRAVEVLGNLNVAALATPIEHLHIHKRTAERLISNGVKNLLELITTARDFHSGKLWAEGERDLHRFWGSIDLIIEDRICQLARSVSAGKVDWVSFLELIDYELTFGAAKLDETFDLDEETKSLSIDCLNIGKAVFLLRDDGILTVGQLVSKLSAGLPDYRGFGKNKLRVFASGLREFVATINADGTSSSLTLSREEDVPPTLPGYRGTVQYTARNRARMSEETKLLTLGQIHLHKEISKLHRIGVDTLDQLFELFQNGLPDIRGIGKKSRITLFNTVRFADQAITDSGGIDWDRFARLAGMRVLPEPETPLQNGGDFLASMDGIVASLTTNCFDEVESATLTQRLIPTDEATSTLESIARNFSLSRERIRQKQEIVLRALSSALIDDDYEGLHFRFSEQFSTYWKAAALHFGANETLSYVEFIAGLVEVWGVSEALIRPHLPLIYSILTKESSLPTVFARISFIPEEVFQITNTADLNRRFRSLHPTRSLMKAVEKLEVFSLGQLLSILCSEKPSFSRVLQNKLLTEIFSPLSKSVSPSGAVIWEKYYELKKVTVLPESDSSCPADFVKSAVGVVTEFVSRTQITLRSEGILVHRVVPDAESRKTLAEAGKIYESSGPQIKREENELLERLHDVIFGEDYTDAKIHFRSSFIQKWHKAKHVCQQAKGVPYFAELLGLEWSLSNNAVMKVAPMIASVIKGRPPGYTGKRFSLASNKSRLNIGVQDQGADSPPPPAVIRLRGFRYIH
jgi:hypothetical protein